MRIAAAYNQNQNPNFKAKRINPMGKSIPLPKWPAGTDIRLAIKKSQGNIPAALKDSFGKALEGLQTLRT